MSTDIPIYLWDQRFSQESYVYGTEPNDFLKDSAGFITSGKVLCLADGEGRNGVYLAQQGHAVTSVDASSVGLNKATKLAASRSVRIKTVVADLADFKIEDNSWDAIVSIFCHLPVELRCRVHKQVVTGLRPGGLFLLEAYTPDQVSLGTGGPKSRDLLMTLDGLKKELTGMEFIHAAELTRNVLEGSLHTGMSAVVQVIARKPIQQAD